MTAPPSRPVLVVDDDGDIREAIRDALELEGFPVATAGDGEAALKFFHEGGNACLILLDLMMPGMSGWDFRKSQLEDPALARIPVVVFSADGSTPEKAAKLGADGFLKKPVDFATLLGTVERYCAR